MICILCREIDYFKRSALYVDAVRAISNPYSIDFFQCIRVEHLGIYRREITAYLLHLRIGEHAYFRRRILIILHADRNICPVARSRAAADVCAVYTYRLRIRNVSNAVELEVARRLIVSSRGFIVWTIDKSAGAGRVPQVDEHLRRSYPLGVGSFQCGAERCGDFAVVVNGVGRKQTLFGDERVEVGREAFGDEITPPTYIAVYESFIILVCIINLDG